MLDMNAHLEAQQRQATVSASPSPVPTESSASAVVGSLLGGRGRKGCPPSPTSDQRTGRWSLDEKLLFLYGLKKYGKGRWKKISVYLPRRSLVQIKSHAQKVMKRFDSGEDVLQRLDENQIRTEALVANIHDCLQEQGMKPPRGMTSIQMQQQPFQKIVKVTDAREQIVAASALCQLSQPALAERGPSFLLPTPSGHPDIRHIVLGSVITASGNVVKI